VARNLARINPQIFEAIWSKAKETQPRITRRAIYDRIQAVRKEYGNAISPRMAANVLASRMGIDVYRIVKDKDELNEIRTELIRIRDFPSRILLRDVLKKTVRVVSRKKPSKKIFIVHGRDNKPVKELKKMLEGFGLKPIVLREQPSGSMTIIEQLEKHSKNVDFAFVLLTPDDALVPATKVEDSYVHDPKSLIFRVRQNVILEFGYFISKIGRKNVRCLYKGDTELPFDIPSDMHGIIYLPFKTSLREIKDDITKQLKAVGYDLQMQKRKKK
jgi:predicted nucleotide-binding protein